MSVFKYRTLIIFVSGFLSLVLLSCGPITEPLMHRGGIYIVEDGRGGFRPAKMLEFDSTVVHVKLYSNPLVYRVDTIASDTLRLEARPGELPSHKHFPMSRQLFASWSPELRGFDSVRIDEIEMVEEWKKSGGEVVGERW